MDLVAFVEKEYGIHVEMKEIVPDNFDSINKLARFISSRLASAPSSI